MNKKKGKIISILITVVLFLMACSDNHVVQEASTEASDESDILISVEKSLRDDISDLMVEYSKDLSKDNEHFETDELFGDWNADGDEDRMKIEVEEVEGSSVIKRLELDVSGAEQKFRMEEKAYDFVHIFNGDFDGDGEQEIALLFDIRYSGANGGLGLYLLKQTDEGWNSVLGEEAFTGFSYQVSVDREKSTYKITSGQSAQEFVLEKEKIPERIIDEVSPFYSIEVLSGGEQDYIRIRQYIAGEDMTDHIGDMVSVLCWEDGSMCLVDEYAEW